MGGGANSHAPGVPPGSATENVNDVRGSAPSHVTHFSLNYMYFLQTRRISVSGCCAEYFTEWCTKG